MNNVTKKLQALVRRKKMSVVVTKQGSVKFYRYSSSGPDAESYCYTNYSGEEDYD